MADGTEEEATISLFRAFDNAGRDQEYLPSGWEEARKVTSILVEAANPKDGYTAEHAVEVARQFDVRVVEAFGRLLGDAKGHTSL